MVDISQPFVEISLLANLCGSKLLNFLKSRVLCGTFAGGQWTLARESADDRGALARIMHQLAHEIGRGFDWLKNFLAERNNDVYFRVRRSRPSVGSAAFWRPVRQKIIQAIKDYARVRVGTP